MMHALVVGGTGMLSEVVYYFVKQGYVVSVLARHEDSIEKLKAKVTSNSENLHGWAIDYHDTKALEGVLHEAITKSGPIHLTVAWIHSTANEAPFIVAKNVTLDFFHVRSSSVRNFDYQDPFDIPAIQALPQLHYHRVILGSIPEGSGSRWLTDKEIVAGVIKSIESGVVDSIVGA